MASYRGNVAPHGIPPALLILVLILGIPAIVSGVNLIVLRHNVFHRGTEQDGNAPVSKELFHAGRDLAIHQLDQVCVALEQRDLRPERGLSSQIPHRQGLRLL